MARVAAIVLLLFVVFLVVSAVVTGQAPDPFGGCTREVC